jgi:hypothetical protein
MMNLPNQGFLDELHMRIPIVEASQLQSGDPQVE